MIGIFSRQREKANSGDRGQALPLFLVTLSAIISLVFATVYVSHLGSCKVAASIAVDSIALSAATWEARGLNLIASLNDGILQCFRVIRWTCTAWAALAVAACFGVGIPAFAAYSKRAPGLIRSYWKCALSLADWSVKIKNITPYLVIAETISLSKTLDVTGAIHPIDPRGPHDGKNTLELHLKEGPPLSLLDAIAPIRSIVEKLGNWKWAQSAVRQVTAILSRAINTILGPGQKNIRMLIPEEDFPTRQKILFAGVKTSTALPGSLCEWAQPVRFSSQAIAEPYGGDTATMTWRSRLTEKAAK